MHIPMLGLTLYTCHSKAGDNSSLRGGNRGEEGGKGEKRKKGKREEKREEKEEGGERREGIFKMFIVNIGTHGFQC